MRTLSIFLCTVLLIPACGEQTLHLSGVASVGSSSVTPVDTSITGVTINFWDDLPESERLRIVDEIRQAVIEQEVSNNEEVNNLTIDFLVTNNIDNDVDVEVVDDNTISVACKEPHHFNREHLKHYLCKWLEHECDDD